MNQSQVAKLVAKLVVKSFPIKDDRINIGPCSSEYLLLIFVRNGIQTEFKIPILEKILEPILIQIEYDPDDERVALVTLTTLDGKPTSLQVTESLVWDTAMPFIAA